ncbi:MAG TPA: phenylalanine--tRNA ligase subunit beta [Candidatus Saccharimonadales bacterium]|nr:phenylalanine--tRNA ligase subunit beta [Candidatus Saccharimonadales bacterium]
MKVSVNTLQFLNEHYHSAGHPAPDGVDDLVQKIGAQLGAVEEVIPFGKKYEGVLIVKVVSCADHPNADRLHVCMVDDGGRAKDVERNEQGLVQVVCGAPNVREGLNVAWLPPGATVPESYGKDPFVLEARALRGVVSNGMLASPRELALGDSHEGILEIDGDVEPGTLFTEAYQLQDDVVIDMENKMFTHRPDCFGWLGIAREIEGISHRPYKSPEWYTMQPAMPAVEADELPLVVRNELPELAPRFTAITLRDVKVGPSPVWLQVELARVGMRSINNIVDYTNFFMLETGQPLHAYDYDKVVAQDESAEHATLVVRHPAKDEKILLLNGKEVQPRDQAIMIATNDKLIGLGGVMGGGDTEVDDTTTNIIIECANFDMYSIRRTSMAHGLFTDAVTRFNKGQSPLQNLAVLAKIVDEIRTYAGGKVASAVIDDNHLPTAVMERGSLHPPVTVSRMFINARLGFDLAAEDMAQLLRNVEFAVTVSGDDLTVTAPFWRTDIESKEDVVEEVGRLYGFDHLPLELPKRDLTPAIADPMFALKRQVRDVLSKAGANEVLSYSFVHGNLLDKAGQNRDLAFKVANALSPDLQYYRMSIQPSLLEKVQPNIKAGYDEFALFEMNKVHNKLHAADDNGVPTEFSLLALTFAANDKRAEAYSGAPYYQARKFLTFLAAQLGVSLVFVPVAEELHIPVMEPFDYKRAALVMLPGSEEVIGVVGEYKAATIKGLKLPAYSAGFELSLDELLKQVNKNKQYLQLPRFPKVEQDICLRVPSAVTYQDTFQFVWDRVAATKPDQTYYMLGPIDIYQREGEAEHKQITFRLSIASYERTLTTDEVNALLEGVAKQAKEVLHAERV